MNKRSLADLHMLVEHVGPLHAGDHLFRKGDPFSSIAAVRVGTVKTYVVDRDGGERVLGFHLPGEVIGLDAIDGAHYPCSAVALDTVALCRFSFSRIAELASRMPGLQQQLFRLLSRNISAAVRLTGDWSADQRMAAFLLGLSQRLAAR
ncbi:MAG: cyclic nucleotide-binding domain-containing protein, partial [Casimicrobiaceae bacterium]